MMSLTDVLQSLNMSIAPNKNVKLINVKMGEAGCPSPMNPKGPQINSDCCHRNKN